MNFGNPVFYSDTSSYPTIEYVQENFEHNPQLFPPSSHEMISNRYIVNSVPGIGIPSSPIFSNASPAPPTILTSSPIPYPSFNMSGMPNLPSMSTIQPILPPVGIDPFQKSLQAGLMEPNIQTFANTPSSPIPLSSVSLDQVPVFPSFNHISDPILDPVFEPPLSSAPLDLQNLPQSMENNTNLNDSLRFHTTSFFSDSDTNQTNSAPGFSTQVRPSSRNAYLPDTFIKEKSDGESKQIYKSLAISSFSINPLNQTNKDQSSFPKSIAGPQAPIQQQSAIDCFLPTNSSVASSKKSTEFGSLKKPKQTFFKKASSSKTLISKNANSLTKKKSPSLLVALKLDRTLLDKFEEKITQEHCQPSSFVVSLSLQTSRLAIIDASTAKAVRDKFLPQTNSCSIPPLSTTPISQNLEISATCTTFPVQQSHLFPAADSTAADSFLTTPKQTSRSAASKPSGVGSLNSFLGITLLPASVPVVSSAPYSELSAEPVSKPSENSNVDFLASSLPTNKPKGKSLNDVLGKKHSKKDTKKNLVTLKLSTEKLEIIASKILAKRNPTTFVTIKPVESKPKSDKPVHPFFNKPAKAKDVSKESKLPEPIDQKQSETEMSSVQPNSESSIQKQPSLTFGLFKSAKPSKRLVSKEAPWPNIDQMHVRGFQVDESETTSHTNRPLFLTRGQYKYTPHYIPESESILGKLNQEILQPFLAQDLMKLKMLKDEGNFPIPPIRIPKKIVIGSNQINSIIRSEITDKDSLSILEPLLTKIPHQKSAFQQNLLESNTWAHKYAPELANTVMTADFKAVYVRNWLLNRLKELETKRPSTVVSKRKRRKMKKTLDDDLDGFIVNDNTIEYEVSEDSITVEDTGTNGSNSRCSPIGNDILPSASQPEILILYGPPGSGKTSSVYAACKELDIYVFEINPSERRTGKAVMEKLEGMSSSHLVHSSKNQKSSFKNSFFKSAQLKAVAEENQELSNPNTGSLIIEKAQKPKPQQQKSVVLLDEADILFDEESSFWPAILEKFLVTTKRPVIITCSDPSRLSSELLARYSCNDEALLQFEPAPVNIQVDTLWAIAFAEGHYLNKDSLYQLVNDSGNDFRKALNQLQFWCQMGLGDRLSGVHWIMKAKDVNNGPDSLSRLVSKDTFIGVESEEITGTQKPLVFSQFEAKVQNPVLDSLNAVGRRNIICTPPLTKYQEYSDNLLQSLDITAGISLNDSVSLDTLERLCDALSCADILQTKSHSAYTADEVSNNLEAIAQEVDELPVPQDYIIGERYPANVDSLITQAYTEPLSFEKVLYPDIVKTAFTFARNSLASDFVQSPNSQIEVYPSLSPEKSSRTVETNLRQLYYPLTISIGSYSWVTNSHHNTIDTSSSRVLATEIAPYVRQLAFEDVQKEEIIEAAKTQYIAEQTKKQEAMLRSNSSESFTKDRSNIATPATSSVNSSINHSVAVSRAASGNGTPNQSFSNIPTCFSDQDYGSNAQNDIYSSYSPNDSLPQSQSKTGVFSQLSQTIKTGSTRTTMRTIYAALGHSATEVVALTRRYLPDSLDLASVMDLAPDICKRMRAEQVRDQPLVMLQKMLMDQTIGDEKKG